MRFYFHDLAQAEFDSAVQYYDDCRRGLGMEFAKEVHATIARIIKYPDAWSPMSKNTRLAWSTGSLLVSCISSSLTAFTSSQLQIFDVTRSTG